MSSTRPLRLKMPLRGAAIGLAVVGLFSACAPQDEPATRQPAAVTVPRRTAPPITVPPAPPLTAYTPPPRPTFTPRTQTFQPLPTLPASNRLVPTYTPSRDVDCPDIGREVWVGSYDPHNLDADGDGWGCELQGAVEDFRGEADDLLSDLDYDSPFYDDADDLFSRADDIQNPDDLDDFYNDLDDLRSDVEDYEE